MPSKSPKFQYYNATLRLILYKNEPDHSRAVRKIHNVVGRGREVIGKSTLLRDERT